MSNEKVDIAQEQKSALLKNLFRYYKLHHYNLDNITSHLIIWTAIPVLTNNNLPLDTIEALAWGSNLDWGFNKHPPMSAFAVEIFYQIFDHGQAQDGQGRVIDFRNTVIIMTSNIGTRNINSSQIGFSKGTGQDAENQSHDILKEVKKYFIPEVYGGIEEIECSKILKKIIFMIKYIINLIELINI